MLTIGLTGNIGSGKSTVAGILRDAGMPVLDADQVGHDALLPGGAAYEQVREAFGQEYLKENGELDRELLGKCVFTDTSGWLRERLNEITHPAILNYIKSWLKEQEAEGAKAVAVESALLYKSGLEDLVDQVWLIKGEREQMISRAAKRDNVEEINITMRLNYQMPQEEMEKRANVVIGNTGSLDELKEAVLKEYAKVK